MDVTDEAVSMGNGAQLIQNLGPDDLYVRQDSDVDEDTGFKIAMGECVAVGYSNGGVMVVSAGESDVRVLAGGTGFFTVPA